MGLPNFIMAAGPRGFPEHPTSPAVGDGNLGSGLCPELGSCVLGAVPWEAGASGRQLGWCWVEAGMKEVLLQGAL